MSRFAKTTSSTKKEVEIKFVVTDLKALIRQLRSSGFRMRTSRTLETNSLYDAPDGSISQRGEVLRIRRYGKRWILTHKTKGVTGRHKSRTETETELEDGEALHAILLSLGFRVGFRYEKFRTEWTDGKGMVVVDETPIGNIAEIEGTEAWIDRTAAKLGVQPTEYSTASYVQLFSDWKATTGSGAKDMTWEAIHGKTRSKQRP